MTDWSAIAAAISQALGEPFAVRDRASVSGGCINQAYRVRDGQRSVFVKLNRAVKQAMFAAEFEGLAEIYHTQTVRVPRPLCYGVASDAAYIALEWLPLGRGDAAAWAKLGERLAALHRVTSDRGFGWHRPNTIGETPQVNDWDTDWTTFFRQQRLAYQLQLARRRGGHFPQAIDLLAALPQLLGHDPAPALLHGDLWSGNAAVTEAGEPVILDPATYYGDREADIAMTELFGRFPPAFYQAYEAAYPLPAGYEQRRSLYNLYHVLNHFNLFGGGYGSQANCLIDQILASA